ncbi:MAG: Na+/H+ antiporter NhaA [Gemmatimonadetes bacterium]|nr:Na+/H+ antiporter NhaA [Gemmatimonadota bacterium]
MSSPSVEVRLERPRPWVPFASFFRTEAASGVVLIACAALALLWANSPWRDAYFAWRELPVAISVGGASLEKGLVLWINDALMAVFFFVVGLEIKRELRGGELASLRSAALPLAGALGGALVPAVVYLSLNASGPGRVGWAVPMATDIAFALGVLALVGSRAPLGLKVFLSALAIVDDLLAVLVIAVFYTADVSLTALGAATLLFAALLVAARAGVRAPAVFLVLGVALWFAVLKSGVHATVAGVLTALAIPHQAASPVGDVPRAPTLLERLEHGLQPWVAFGILPLFALANAGVAVPADPLGAVRDPVATGIALGLLVGKPVGILLAAALVVRLGWAALPGGVTWRHLHGASWLCAIGFTMALFIAGLAFGPAPELDTAKLAVLAASTVAGLVGWLLLRGAPRSA